jgi:hypothetical protein
MAETQWTFKKDLEYKDSVSRRSAVVGGVSEAFIERTVAASIDNALQRYNFEASPRTNAAPPPTTDRGAENSPSPEDAAADADETPGRVKPPTPLPPGAGASYMWPLDWPALAVDELLTALRFGHDRGPRKDSQPVAFRDLPEILRDLDAEYGHHQGLLAFAEDAYAHRIKRPLSDLRVSRLSNSAKKKKRKKF